MKNKLLNRCNNSHNEYAMKRRHVDYRAEFVRLCKCLKGLINDNGNNDVTDVDYHLLSNLKHDIKTNLNTMIHDQIMSFVPDDIWKKILEMFFSDEHNELFFTSMLTSNPHKSIYPFFELIQVSKKWNSIIFSMDTADVSNIRITIPPFFWKKFWQLKKLTIDCRCIARFDSFINLKKLHMTHIDPMHAIDFSYLTKLVELRLPPFCSIPSTINLPNLKKLIVISSDISHVISKFVVLEILIVMDHPTNMDASWIINFLPKLKVLGLYGTLFSHDTRYEEIANCLKTLTRPIKLETNYKKFLTGNISGSFMDDGFDTITVTHCQKWTRSKPNGRGSIKVYDRMGSENCRIRRYNPLYNRNLGLRCISYSGKFREGQYHGNGVAYRNNIKYVGKWRDGKPIGKFDLYFTDDNHYHGTIDNQKRPHGSGIVHFTCQLDIRGTYEGEWVDGKRHGNGMLTMTDGSIYSGEWLDGVLSGHGYIRYGDGTEYRGDVSKYLRHGHGEFVSANGDREVCEWCEDVKK